MRATRVAAAAAGAQRRILVLTRQRVGPSEPRSGASARATGTHTKSLWAPGGSNLGRSNLSYRQRLILIKTYASPFVWTPDLQWSHLLRRMRHQEHWRAVGTHYGPTRIHGPTGHAIGGTAQLALRSSSPGRVTLSDDYGPGVAAGGWTSPPPPPAIA